MNRMANCYFILQIHHAKSFKMRHIKVETFLEQREVAFLSPSKICENLNFSTEKAKTNKNEKWDEINISKIVY